MRGRTGDGIAGDGARMKRPEGAEAHSQGSALGIIAISNTPCKGKSIYTRNFKKSNRTSFGPFFPKSPKTVQKVQKSKETKKNA